ncbi:hypothetical protein [Hydrocoleum sp. CS-953]|nr:hypothetical protein [Hydrocoleum sp. CS-953]
MTGFVDTSIDIIPLVELPECLNAFTFMSTIIASISQMTNNSKI